MKRRILLTTLTVAAIAVVVFGVPLGLVVRHQYRNEAILQLERHTIEAALTVDNSAMQGTDLAELPLVPGTRLALYRPDGTRVTGNGPLVGDAAVVAAQANRVADSIGDEGIVVAVPIVSNEQVVGVLRGERGPSSFESRIWRAWIVMAGLALSAVVVAGLVATRLARRLSRPLDRVHEAAMRLGDGDFTVSVEASGISELDDVGSALTSTASRLGSQIARERTLSADASHQLRTPLTGLRLVLETERDFPRPDRTAVIDDALHEVDRLEQTIDDLLKLARNAAVDRHPLDLPRMLIDTERRWHGRLASAGRRIVVDIDPDHGGSFASPKASPSAVNNITDVLIDNAVRHGSGQITLSLRPVDGGIAVAVSDEGVGISGDPEAIFQRRQHLGGSSTSGAQRPHGIGLALARSLAEAEGGRLQLAHATPHPRFELILPSNNGLNPTNSHRKLTADELDPAAR